MKKEMIKAIKMILEANVNWVYTNEQYRYLLNRAESTISSRYSKEELSEVLAELSELMDQEDAPFCETPAAKELVYINVSSEKSDLKDTPFMDGGEWFRAKYGKYESEIRMEMSKIVPDGFEGDLTSFYHLHCGSVSSIEEGDSYQDNDADCWNDYRRAWDEVNKVEQAAPVETPVCENPFCDKNPCVCDIPSDCPFCESNPCKCCETKGEYCKPCGATGMIQHTECPYCKGSGIVDVAAPVEKNGITTLVKITPKCYRVQIGKKYLGYVTFDKDHDKLGERWLAGSPSKERAYYGETAQEAADEMYRAMYPKLRDNPLAELAAHKVHLETSHKFVGPDQLLLKETIAAARAFEEKKNQEIGELEWIEVDETPAPAIPMDLTLFMIGRTTDKRGLIRDLDRFKYYYVDLEAGTFYEIDQKEFDRSQIGFKRIFLDGTLAQRMYEIVYKPLEHDGQDDLTPITQEELDKMGPLDPDEDLLSLEELEEIEKQEQEKKEEQTIKINPAPYRFNECYVCQSKEDVKILSFGDGWSTTSIKLCRSDREKLLQLLQDDLQPEEVFTWEDVVQDAVGSGITGDQILKIAKGEKL